MDLRWMERAVCRETEVDENDLMYPEREDYPSAAHYEAAVNRAKAACARCPVRQECLLHALATKDRHGIWGGTTWDDRRRLLSLATGAEVAS